MTEPGALSDIRKQIRWLAMEGYGIEDIMVRLRLGPGPGWREVVKEIVMRRL